MNLHFATDTLLAPSSNTTLLKNINLEFVTGKTYFIAGSNGVGKTTLLKSLFKAWSNNNQKEFRKSIIYATPRAMISAEDMKLCKFARALNLEMNLEKWGLSTHRSTPVSGLSVGQKTRLILAFLDKMKPAILLFDEPTIGLDDDGQKLFIDFLKYRNEKALVTIVASQELIIFPQDAELLFVKEKSIENMTDKLLQATCMIKEQNIEINGTIPIVAQKLLNMQIQDFYGDQ